MAKLLTIGNLTTGMRTDANEVGSLRECVDLLPWRGAVRRRGPITANETHAYGATFTLAPELSSTHHARMTRRGATTLHAVARGTADTTIWPNSEDLHVDLTGFLPGRSFEVEGELVLLQAKHVAAATDQARCFNGAINLAAGTGTGTGTVSVTASSKHAIFSSSTGATQALSAGYIKVGANYYQIEKLITSTTAQLVEIAQVTAATSAFDLYNYRPHQASPSAASSSMFNSANAATGNYAGGLAGCYHQRRVFFANIQEATWSGTASTIQEFPYRIRWSGLPSETIGAFTGKNSFDDDAFLDLSNEGGRIVGLASLDGSLVVIRDHAIQVITGGFASSGADVGASINTVATGIGAKGIHAWRQFEDGIVFADQNGCYIWDGESVANITRGVIELAWRKQFTGANADRMIVSAPGSRITVTNDVAGAEASWFVFDTNHTCWVRMKTSAAYSNIVEDATGKFLATRQQVFTDTIRTYNFRTVFDNLNSDVADRAVDADQTASTYPVPYLLTNPIALSNGFENGRVIEVILNDGGGFGDTEYNYRGSWGGMGEGPLIGGDNWDEANWDAILFAGYQFVGTNYTAGDVVTFEGDYYICVTDHFADVGDAPSVSTNWDPFAIPTTLMGYNIRLLRGAIYSDDFFSGEMNLAPTELTSATVPALGSDGTVEQRSVAIKTDGADEASHVMLEVRVLPQAQASSFAYALNAAGLVIDENPTYESV